MSATESLTYEEACEAHSWRVPERYNIAAEVCDSQPADRTAMVFEDFRGTEREVSWAEQRSLADRAARAGRATAGPGAPGPDARADRQVRQPRPR